MSQEMSAQVRAQMEHDFANNGAILQQVATRFNSNIAHVSEESAKTFQLTQRLIGATAQNLLEQHGQANMQTQLKASGIFPGIQQAPAAPAHAPSAT